MQQKSLPRLCSLQSDNLKSKTCPELCRRIKNRKLVGIVAIVVALEMCGAVAQAQQPTKIPRIGYLTGSSAPTATTSDLNAEAFRQGLRDLGYIEGQNILIEYRYREGKPDRAPSLVNELLQLKIDVLVSPDAAGILAAKQATKTIPIVIVTNQDPVAAGYIDSLARPGGNVTGLTRLTRELSGKRLELLKEMVPKLSRAGLLSDADSPTAGNAFKDYEGAARALKIQFQSLEVRGPNPNFEEAFQAAAKGGMSALITLRNLLLIINRKQIAGLAIKNRLPLMTEGSDFAESGALASYASDDVANFKRAAYYVEKILKGTKPADLPVEQPTKFELVINLKTAKQIGLTIPQAILYRADKVIK